MVEKRPYQAILKAKCPKCRTGDMFMYPLNQISKFARMNTHCKICDLRFEVEPGFFFGAMYISYAITVAILITTGVVLWFFDWDNIYLFLGIITTTILLLLPFIFRYSRVLFLHWFGGVKYNKNLAKD